MQDGRSMRLLFIKVEFVSDTSDAVDAWVQANIIRSIFDAPQGGAKITFVDGFTLRVNEKAAHLIKRLQHIHPTEIQVVDQ
jgi:hypothetical protein